MTFLPIVERELRVAARKRSTFWIRTSAALVAFIIFGGTLVLMQSRLLGSMTGIGKGLFTVLTWLIFGGALCAGLFFTSDCLSQEKRDGTLGLLFLTDLRGYDVVIGKLATSSLRCFYVLLAVLPVVATTLLMGGVTGAQFWRTVLALVNGLLFSLVVGLFVSSVSRDSQKALTATLFLTITLVGAGPAADSLLSALKIRSSNPFFSLTSPGFLFVSAGALAQPPISKAFWINQLIVWAFLLGACVLLPRAWQEKGVRRTANVEPVRALARSDDRLRERLFDLNPVLWLISRQGGRPIAFFVAILVQIGATCALMFWKVRWGWVFWSSFSGLLILITYLAVASSAARFFVEGRRNGLIELLLGTPVSAPSIIDAQRRALWRWFGVPLGIWVVAQLVGGYMSQREQMAMMVPPAAVKSANAPPTNGNISTTQTTTVTGVGMTVSVAGSNGPSPWALVVMQLVGTVIFVANVWAVAWFGMWMGMISQSTNMATLRTLAFVQVIPWFAITFLSAFVPLLLFWTTRRTGFSMSRQMIFSSVVPSLFFLAKDIVIGLVARRNLYLGFRRLAIGSAVSLPAAEATPMGSPLPRTPAAA